MSGLVKRFGMIYLRHNGYHIPLTSASIGWWNGRKSLLTSTLEHIAVTHSSETKYAHAIRFKFDKGSPEFEMMKKYIHSGQDIPGYQASDFTVPDGEVVTKPKVKPTVNPAVKLKVGKTSNGFSF